MPYFHQINYLECKVNGVRIFDKSADLFSVMIVCRHNGVIAYMLNIGESTIQRIFVAWVILIEVVFSKIVF